MNVIFSTFGYAVMNGLKFIEDILDGLHEDWLETPGKRVGMVGVVFFQVRVCL
jgi:hypothetical protein